LQVFLLSYYFVVLPAAPVRTFSFHPFKQFSATAKKLLFGLIELKNLKVPDSQKALCREE